ncbi:C-type lectin domain family 4 member M [Merluccius polli]|uniref:C-type lectin domain family 4 member M n=1 Tax=Merluccius polli TaxID=89951 RepID=A0AA47P2J0_MERPO|nr:C-type lectin domain family 4 member M [Merluccius polli]
MKAVEADQRGTMATIHELDSGLTEEHEDMSFHTKVTRKRRSDSETPCTEERQRIVDALGDLTRRHWLYYNHRLYFISTTKRNWMASRDYCLQRDADLVVINSRDEQEFVSELGGYFWIGLSKRDPEGTWKWVDGTNMTSSSWGPDQPDDNDGAEDCVAVRGDGWHDERCDRLKSWICEKVVVLDHLEAELNKEVMRGGEAPVFIYSPSSNMVSVGNRTRFSCRAMGNPEPTIEWLHNDRPLKRDRTDNQSEPAVWMDMGDLVIRGVRSGVETVRCVANNSAGTASSDTGKLYVYDRRPDDWLYFNHSLYFISTTERNWTASRDYCLQRDADLIVINSREEEEFVSVLRGDHWIGLSKRDPEGTWKWVDGTNMTSSSWGPDQIDDEYGAQDCVEVRWNGWNDERCNRLNYWICEKVVVLLRDSLDDGERQRLVDALEACVEVRGDGWYDAPCDSLNSWMCEKVVVLDHLEAELNKEGL